MDKSFKLLNKIYIFIAFALAAVMLTINIYIKMNGIDGTTMATIDALRLVVLILVILLFVMWAPVTIVSIVHAAKSKTSITGEVLSLKLIYIVFFLVNFINCIVAIFGFDDYNIYGISKPILAFLMIFLTYLVLLAISLPGLVNFIKLYITKKIKVSASGIIWSILLFVFCVDVLSIVFLYFNEKKYLPEEVTRRKLRILEKGKEWQTKKGMNFNLFKGLYIGLTVLMYGFVILLVTSVVITITQNSVAPEEIEEVAKNQFIQPSLIGLAVSILAKFVFGLIYGKNGKEDPTKFILVMKYVELPVVIVLFAFAALMFLASSIFMVLGFALVIFIVVIIIALAVISFLLMSTITLGVGCGTVLEMVLLIYSGNMTVFSYYMNQRKMNNVKFANKMTIVYLVFLFIPIFDIVALHQLKKLSTNNEILGDKPVIDINQLEK